METEFGALLKDWRARRRMSQLDLGVCADVSARHISFLETGRARPSREMVMHLGEVLEVPRADRNLMLHAAGFAAAYPSRGLESAELDAARRAADWMIERHEPYPALIIDRHWELIAANRPALAMLAAFGIGEGASLLDGFIDGRIRSAIDNWPEFGGHLLTRLRSENSAAGGDPVLEATIGRLASDLTVAAEASGPLPPFVPTRLRMGDATLSFLSTLAHFAGAEDVMLADLRIELLFPADEGTRLMLLALSGEHD